MTTTIDKNDGKMASNNPGESNSNSIATSPIDIRARPVGKDAKKIAAGIVTMAKHNGVALGVVSKDAATTPLAKNNQSNAKVVTVGKSETKKMTSDVVGGGGTPTTATNNDIHAAPSSEGTPVNTTVVPSGFHHNTNTSPFAVNNQQQRDQALLTLHNMLNNDMVYKKQCYAHREKAAHNCLVLHHALHATFCQHDAHLQYWAAANPDYVKHQQVEMMTHWNPILQHMGNQYEMAKLEAVAAYRAAQIAENFLKLFIQTHGGTAIGAGNKRDESPTAGQEPASKKMRVSPDNEEEIKARGGDDAEKFAQTI